MNHKLPAALLDFARKYRLCNGDCKLHLKKNIDAWGNPLETEFAQVYVTENEITEATNALSRSFPKTEDYGVSADAPEMPGAIADIVEFSKIICFGMSADGSPFCLDYRLPVPAVIWWDDNYWRKISPDFQGFISLFKVGD